MENKGKNKKISFLKREGFYVVLFICLCIVAVVTALTVRNGKKIENNTKTSQVQKSNVKQNNELANSLTQEENKEIYNNAVEVKRKAENKTASKNTGIEAVKSEDANVAVSKAKNPEFIKPVDGEIVKKYSLTPVHWETSNTERPNFGINIKAKEGSMVKAVAKGEVKSVENGDFGVTVVIYHAEYGNRTVYANLDKNVKVKAGEKVDQGKEIGKIGKTAIRGCNEKYGKNFLHFEVLKGSKGDSQSSSENPEKYIKY